MQLKVLKIHSATHFSARIEKHRTPDGETSDLLNKDHIYVPIEMSEFYGQAKNR